MGVVFVNVGMTLDGFIAPDGMDMEHADNPGHKDWLNRWMNLQDWLFHQQFLRRNLHLGEGGETGPDNAIVEHTFNRTGASILGKRMFDLGEHSWPEEAPFHTPVFVLTHQMREPWERPGGTTFYFVNDGIESALKQAQEAAGTKDIRIGGGADVIRQYLNAGLVDQLEIALAPVIFGSGTRLFDGIDHDRFELEITEAASSPRVTHLRYAVHPK